MAGSDDSGRKGTDGTGHHYEKLMCICVQEFIDDVSRKSFEIAELKMMFLSSSVCYSEKNVKSMVNHDSYHLRL